MDEEELAGIRAGLLAAQAIAISAQYVVRELMVEVAHLHPDPDRFLTTLYDRVADRLDRSLERQPKQALAEARDYVGAMFRDARARLQSPPPEGPQPDAIP